MNKWAKMLHVGWPDVPVTTHELANRQALLATGYTEAQVDAYINGIAADLRSKGVLAVGNVIAVSTDPEKPLPSVAEVLARKDELEALVDAETARAEKVKELRRNYNYDSLYVKLQTDEGVEELKTFARNLAGA